MTALAPPAGRRRADGPPGPVRWRSLAWVTWRQHRAALTASLGVLGLVAVLVILAGLLRGTGPGHGPVMLPPPRGERITADASRILLQLIPVLAGTFLGAPLVARELETRTARMTWTQGADRARWLIAQAVPLAGLLAAGALGLAVLARWGLDLSRASQWSGSFTLNPLPFAGWTLASFCLGVLLGAAVRRTVPAMAATAGCYGILMWVTLVEGRLHYLPPLHRFDSSVQFSGGGTASYGFDWAVPAGSHAPDYLDSALGFPDGRLLSNAQLGHSATWLRAHHVGVWTTYQPGSRYGLFELIEFGWLAALSVILVAAAVVLVRRRAA